MTACARQVSLDGTAAYRALRPSRGNRLESLEPFRYAGVVRRALHATGGAGAYDVAWWLFPQGADDMVELLPAALPLAIGPVTISWPQPGRPGHAPGDLIRGAVRPQLRWLHARTVRRAHAMLAVPAAAACLPVTPRSTAMVPFPVDDTAFGASAVPAEPVVLFVGQLARRKGVADLIEAWPAVLRVHPEARLVIAGDGPLAARLRDRVRALDLQAAVELLGAVDHARIAPLMRRCALLAAPSDGEPYGMTVLEAMSTGRAVIVGANGSPGYLIDGDHGGRSVPPGDVAALAGGLTELLGDHALLGAIGARNRARIEREFAHDAVLDRLEVVLSTAARDR